MGRITAPALMFVGRKVLRKDAETQIKPERGLGLKVQGTLVVLNPKPYPKLFQGTPSRG